MKKYYIVLSILVILSSCISGKSTKIPKTRIIKNGSSYSVGLTIKASESYQFHLSPGDSAVFEGYVTIGEGADLSYVGWDGFEPVSGRIVFDDKRELIYENGSCENGRNPLNPILWELHDCGYYNEDNDGDGTIEYIYEITDADYEMAVPIED